MSARYHAGELAVQERAGTRAMAAKLGHGIDAIIPPVAAAFLRAQRLAIVATVDPGGRVWASALAGEPGFVVARDERSVRIDAAVLPGDPLAASLPGPSPAGMLAIDLVTRRRLRLNGALAETDGALALRTDEVFWNCPKYIQRRTPEEGSARVAGEARTGTELTDAEQRWVAGADTFFIATTHATGGADASHRGGNPGFVRVLDGRTLVWPDYAGNGMFQTLGNLAVDPRSGVLFVDFASGATLQLSGRAHVVWETGSVPGAERLVELTVEQVAAGPGTPALRRRLIGRSPFNPS